MTGRDLTRWHHLLDRQAADRPGALALSDTTGARWDYAALDAATTDLADRLDREGARPGDRVMILAENCAAAVAAILAASRIGAVAVPVNARQTAREVGRILEHARPVLVLATTGVSPDAAAHAGRLGAAPINGAFGDLHLARAFASAPDDDRDIATLLYTTGTTGIPKGVMLTHANLLFGGQASATTRGIVAGDLIYCVLPITHVFGLSSVMTAALCHGAPVQLEPRFSPARLHRALQSGVTLFSAVPQMHAQVMHYVKEGGHERLDSPSLRYVSSGAAPLDPAWKRKAEAFYGVALQNGYGMTETTAGTTMTRNRIGDRDISVGPPVAGVEIVIDQGVEGGGNGMGEVVTRGPNVMKGYYRNPEATAAVLDGDGWLRTGDLGRIDEQGRLHILGRSKELIIHGGFNVYPPEVEAVLSDHPQVIQAAVVGWSVEGDEKVVAFVQVAPHDTPSVESLRSFAADRLAGYKRPDRIIMATDLPAAPTGKILKHRLLDHFAEHLRD